MYSRKRLRVKFRSVMDCFESKNNDQVKVLVGQNISYGGIGAKCRTKLSPGEDIRVVLLEENRKISFLMVVKWCKNHFRHYRVGLAFKELDSKNFSIIHHIIKKQISKL